MPETGPARPGRKPTTNPEVIEAAALRLFAEHGYAATTVDMIAAEAGTSRRTFFRWFDTKAGTLWREFDTEVANLSAQLAAVPQDVPAMAAVRRAVVAVNHYRAADVGELRARMTLIGSEPELAASAAVHYDAWERAVSDFVARRAGLAADSLYPLAVGRATLAACRAAFDRWIANADADLTVYLDAALAALADGFADAVLVAEPTGPRRRRRAPRR
ncbi:transcriptional regulator, TetR family [Jatrophihabitans endophyticus]|uniref:Transcriptional regulator, TetR family n=1 Tax=Jatrophihabitans endophyticus TaxID=1206085 RepID=A0A1M5Q335_9ACTN|nr:mycofactocin system transcriptional regulator [Jatrophihabitans endophyticus]SHH08139.1 transcriptional regulator, TetR family [Jatrophihabitans endophyticus]